MRTANSAPNLQEELLGEGFDVAVLQELQTARPDGMRPFFAFADGDVSPTALAAKTEGVERERSRGTPRVGGRAAPAAEGSQETQDCGERRCER